MNVKLNHVLKNLDGDPLKEARTVNGEQETVDIVLNRVCSGALLALDKEDDGAAKVDKYLLATKVHNADEVDLTVEEISLIKDCIATAYPGSIIVGQAWNLLEGN